MSPGTDQRNALRDRSAAPSGAAAGLSIVVPAYNESASLDRVHTRLTEVAQKLAAARALACEVIYVDDGSADDTLAIARGLPATALDVQVVSLSRNFGKEAALLAGLDHARLGAVLFIDGDGQHPPELIETLVGHWLDDDYDVVYTAKAHRDKESFLRRVAVKAFYALLNSDTRMAGTDRGLPPGSAKVVIEQATAFIMQTTRERFADARGGESSAPFRGLAAQRCRPALAGRVPRLWVPPLLQPPSGGFSRFGFSLIIRMRDPFQSVLNLLFRVTFFLIPDVGFDPVQIAGAETHHPVTRLPLEDLASQFLICVVRRGALQLANEFAD